jgi:4-hydroxy-tetrahydrodipicolinate synthase
MFSGSITAIVTPMFVNGEIDFDSLKKLVLRQIKAKTSALVVCGSTGEAPVLTKNESQAVLDAVIKTADHKIPIIAGSGSYSTQAAIDNTKIALELGADACLLVTPYYNRPTQHGLYEHFKKVAESVPVPLILYNVPTRTGCDMLPSTVKKLAQIANIVGLKECVLTTSRVEELVSECGDKIDLFSGNDDEALPAMLLGFKGVISVVSNAFPAAMQKMCELALANDVRGARKLNQQLMPLIQKIFSEANPIGIKWLLKEMGLISDGIRLPLTPLSEQFHAPLKAALSELSALIEINE